jgi:hypothetical protein
MTEKNNLSKAYVKRKLPDAPEPSGRNVSHSEGPARSITAVLVARYLRRMEIRREKREYPL